jgi:UDP:flavonoid glycosyltransferase YjiC (YdhE family)
MRMLFTSTPGFGSFHPVVALAQAARAAGHDVAYATGDERRATVERLGMTFFPAGLGAAEMRALMRSRHPDVQLPPVDFEGRKRVLRTFFGDTYIEAMLPGLLEAFNTWQPDVLIRAHLTYAGWIAAEACKTPYVTVEEFASGEFGWNQGNMEPTLNAWRGRSGLAPDPDISTLHRYLMVVPFPAPLRDPGSPFGSTARRIKPLIFSDSTDDALPDWMDSLPDAQTVHASLGTVSDRPELLRTIIDAAAGEQYTLVLATGPLKDPALFDPLPSNVRAAAYIPHSQLLRRCDAIITHAGAGTLIASISAGLPMVFVPLFGDQLPNAERAAAAGTGIMLDHTVLTPASVRDATRAVLSDNRYRSAVEALRTEIDFLPSHRDAVDWIAEIARTRKPITEGS